MIRKSVGKVKRFFFQDKSELDQNSKTTKSFNKLVDRVSVSRQINRKATQQLTKSDDMLFYLNMVKNGMTVKTGDNEALTRIFTGQKMYVDTRDISVAPHIMLDGQWEMGITKVFKDNINPGDVVFDVGANFGFFGIVAGSELNGTGSVIFIEANKNLVPFISKSVSVNGMLGNSKILNLALGDKEGKLTLNVLDGYMGSSTVLNSSNKSLKQFNTRVDHKDTVRSTSLDLICRENNIKEVNVIKIDIEGYEDFAYKGMSKVIEDSPNLKIFLEFTGPAYKDPEGFFKEMERDFEYINYIAEDSSLIPVSDYQTLESLANGDWAMLLLSKQIL